MVIALLCLFSSSAWAMDCYKDSLGGQSLVTTTLPTFTVPANAPAGQKIWESGDLLVTVYCDHATRDSTKPVSQDPWSEHVYAYILDSFHNTDSLMTNNPYLAFGVTYNGIDYDIPDIKIDTGACLDKQDDKWGDYKEAACNGVTIQKNITFSVRFRLYVKLKAIPKEQFEACQEAMLLYGMQQLNPETGTENYETAYKKTGGFLVIELHRMLFPENEKWCIGWNGFFDEIHKQAIERETEGVKINMPQPTDHLFFQFCHARKHLLASGVGIRQICDILLFAEHYEKEIDWEIFWDRIRMTDGILFAEAIFRLGVQYLGFKEKQFYFPEGVHSMKLDTERLMEDILHSGIHGKGTRSRLHSGTLTLHAAEKRGLSGIFPGLFYMAFPPAKNLLWRFPYLKKHPYLLPFAWGQRLCGYLREGPVLGSVKEIVKTGRKRKEILREYGIFGEKRR
ncbi:MAG: hypothetical protein EGR73_06690 [Lachnospiraceae bacterium]|nr:hypothetical protein [Lachnospiraceae bacterium]